MPRRLIITILAVLILGILSGTAYMVVQRLRIDQETPSNPGTGNNSLTESETGSQQIVNPEADDDGDGLTNAEEALWGTNPNIADTDGDGFLDGEEVEANHNPSIAGPNDLLPAGFIPGRNVAPINPSQSEPLAVDQFFAEGLDLDGESKNYTAEYREQHSPEERTSITLQQYITTQRIVTQLPSPTDRAINKASDNSTLTSYLQIAGDTGVLSDQNLLARSLQLLFQQSDTSGFIDMAESTKTYQEKIILLSVPPAAEPLHRLLLGYSELLYATFQQIALYDTDEVKALVALRQLEEIDARYFPLIQQELSRLYAQ